MSQRLDQYSDCRLHAYADDELDAQEKAAIKDLINYDAEVARRVEDYQALNRDLKLHFGFVVEEPVPKRLLDVVQAESQFLQQYTSTGDITEAKTLVIDRQLAPFPAGSGKTAARETRRRLIAIPMTTPLSINQGAEQWTPAALNHPGHFGQQR